VIDQFLKA